MPQMIVIKQNKTKKAVCSANTQLIENNLCRQKEELASTELVKFNSNKALFQTVEMTHFDHPCGLFCLLIPFRFIRQSDSLVSVVMISPAA